MRENEVVYCVDRADVIDAVGGAWMAAAREGGAAERLAPHNVVGRPLAQFVQGDTTRMFVFAVLAAARGSGAVVSRDYRCDSPTERRVLRMTCACIGDGRVEVRHALVSREPLARRVDVARAQPGEKHFLQRCSVCNRLRVGGIWHEPDSAPIARAVPDGRLRVIYGVCADCAAWSAARRRFSEACSPACETPRTDQPAPSAR